MSDESNILIRHQVSVTKFIFHRRNIYFRHMSIFGLLFFSILALNTQAAVNIVCTSGTQFYIDRADNLLSRYVSYQIANTGPAPIADIWVQISGFTGGVVSLAPNETNLCFFDSLAVGETKTAFFYLQASNITNFPQSHTISVYSGQPPAGTLIASAVFSFPTIGASIAAASNKVAVIVAGPTPPILGGLLTITVDGDCGVIGRNGMLIFSPAGFPDWPANSYELISTEVTLSGGINAVLRNRLFYTASGIRTATYHAVYTFRAVGVASGPAIVSPVATITSGSRMKHDRVDIYFQINPILPAVNPSMIRKNVIPLNITGGDTAAYTISISNTGVLGIQLDSLIDILPMFPGMPLYMTGSSSYNSVPCADPIASDSVLVWHGPFPVGPGEISVLSFNLSFPLIDGVYPNFALGAIGITLIDSTLDVVDYAPAIATVIIGMPNIIMLKSALLISDPLNDTINPKSIPGARILYTITAFNQGFGITDAHSVITDDIIPNGASLYVSDINGAGSGPVVFEDGTPSSGLAYGFGGLGNLSDNLAFSNNGGVTYEYIPTPDSAGLDHNVTNIAINPSGSFQGAGSGIYPNFSIKFVVQLR